MKCSSGRGGTARRSEKRSRYAIAGRPKTTTAITKSMTLSSSGPPHELLFHHGVDAAPLGALLRLPLPGSHLAFPVGTGGGIQLLPPPPEDDPQRPDRKHENHRIY